MNLDDEHVTIIQLASKGEGESAFETYTIPYDTTYGPLRQSTCIPATSIYFFQFPGLYSGRFLPVAERCLILPMLGTASIKASNGDARRIEPGSVLDLIDSSGDGHQIENLDSLPFQVAIVDFEQGSSHQSKINRMQQSKVTLPFLRNITGSDNSSHFEDGELRCFEDEDGSLTTESIAITQFQYVLALGDLSFEFHNAPQRQIVLPFTGGMQGENGDGSRRKVIPGDIYFGEDTTGQGHITRALDGQPRFSIFAHLI